MMAAGPLPTNGDHHDGTPHATRRRQYRRGHWHAPVLPPPAPCAPLTATGGRWEGATPPHDGDSKCGAPALIVHPTETGQTPAPLTSSSTPRRASPPPHHGAPPPHRAPQPQDARAPPAEATTPKSPSTRPRRRRTWPAKRRSARPVRSSAARWQRRPSKSKANADAALAALHTSTADLPKITPLFDTPPAGGGGGGGTDADAGSPPRVGADAAAAVRALGVGAPHAPAATMGGGDGAGGGGPAAGGGGGGGRRAAVFWRPSPPRKREGRVDGGGKAALVGACDSARRTGDARRGANDKCNRRIQDPGH
ncbi:hypothetical protein BU14_0602s0011 [Porphyra umbilicalis]|uniref:Uncharacterized protein n=1 Tax=Porphyra umbilicalis TaxID=2786 RepID=A0A1X6NRA2_PORUM|nr:hypothetical protein BU14_0602s0011 [Porphyra umbilicalis]|eukprot:OSX71102.1 hypothetical protein BU14_0602s0011 [Porphyra umbilicalis]